MRDALYKIVEYIAKAHAFFLKLNDAYEYDFSDKQLHFLVIGMLGMLLVLVIHPLFLLLAKRGHVLIITWIYVFTLILVITFAIEIGQKVSGTGSMEFADIVMGVFGFIVMFLVFVLIRGICKGVYGLLKDRKKNR